MDDIPRRVEASRRDDRSDAAACCWWTRTIDIPFVDKKDEWVRSPVRWKRSGRQLSARSLWKIWLRKSQARGGGAAGNAKTAEADAAERLRIATRWSGGSLKQLAAGDLTVALNEPFASDFEQLRHDFITSVKQLRSTLNQVSHAVTTMDGGTRRLPMAPTTCRNGPNSRQQRLRRPRLPWTKSRRMSRTRQSARIRPARWSNTANNSATQSAKVVADAEEAMRRIEESSQADLPT